MISKINEANKHKESEPSTSEGLTERIEEKLQIVAQEIELSRTLACTDQFLRANALRKLKKWLQLRTYSTYRLREEDHLRIWKGLFYSMWICDKPLNQEQLADEFGKILYCFKDYDATTLFFKAFLKVMALEWNGIDQWRIDKFSMLVRRMFRHMFLVAKQFNWPVELLTLFASSLYASVLRLDAPEGLTLHIADLYLEELAKVANTDIPNGAVIIFIRPFLYYLSWQQQPRMLGYIRNRIFYHLLWQSKKGREFNEKFEAWKEMGFPTESIDDLEKIDDSPEKEENLKSKRIDDSTEKEGTLKKMKHKEENNIDSMDPRAGNVDVYMPELPVEVDAIIKDMERILYTETNTKSRKYLRKLIITYKIFQQGYFPLGIKNVTKPNVTPMQLLIEEKIEDLHKLDGELCSTTRKIKNLSKKARRRLLKSIDFDDLNEENFEEAIDKAIDSLNKKKKTMKDLENDWIEEDILPSVNITIENSSENTLKNGNLNATKSKKENSLKNIKHTKSNKKRKAQEEEIPLLVPINKTAENSNSEAIVNSKESIETKEENSTNFIVPTKKQKLKDSSTPQKKKTKKSNMLLNPFSIKNLTSPKTPQNIKLLEKNKKLIKNQRTEREKCLSTPREKKVKIVLKKNTAQNPSDYLQQVRSSPQLPYDPKNKPRKSLLKPGSLPSPVNPFYKLMNTTF